MRRLWMRTTFRLATGAFLLAVAAGCATAPVSGGKAASAGEELPDPKQDLRTPWSRSSSGFVRDWLLCGVFPNPLPPEQERGEGYQVGVGFHTDYLGGEARARPLAREVVRRPDGRPTAWMRYQSEDDKIDFRKAFAGNETERVVAYAFRTVKRDEPGGAILSIGSDDSVKVWLNGELVHEHEVGRGMRADHDVVPVTFKGGENSLLVKVENGRGGWGFITRILSRAQALPLAVGRFDPKILDVDESDPDTLTVCTDTGLGKVLGTEERVRIEAVMPGGEIVAESSARRGENVAFSAENWPAGPFEIHASMPTPEGHTVHRHLPWFKGDWLAHTAAVLCEIDRAGTNGPAAMGVRVVKDFILARLGGDPRVETAEGEGARKGPQDWKRIHSVLTEYAELKGSAAVRPHGFVRLAWRDEIDGSAQFARAYLPAEYDAGKRWPLVLNLHGYNPRNPRYVDWWGATKRHDPLAERHGVIMVYPHGRGNTGYRGIGDADVMRALQEAKGTFAVDTDHVYLMGNSMGGGGTWHVGTRHPDVFAAIGPIYGGWDYHASMEPEEYAELSAAAKYREEKWSSFSHAEAMLNTPVFVNHGDRDELVDVDYSRYAVQMLQRWGYNVRYWEHPDKGHGGLGCEREMIRWFLTHRLNRDPLHVRVRADHLRWARAHWVTIEQCESPFAFMKADARVLGRGLIQLDTENVLQVRLTPGDGLVDTNGPVRVIWNGQDAGEHGVPPGGVVLTADSYDPGKRHKRRGLAGPLNDVRQTPFAIVCGTISNDKRMAFVCRRRANEVRDWWREWQHAEPRFFLDTEIGDADLRAYSLILIGGPGANAVTKKLMPRLPLRIEAGRIMVGEQEFLAVNAGIHMVYPHPMNPERYVQVTAGNTADGLLLADRTPNDFDFVVVDDKRIGWGSDIDFLDGCLAAGYFDANWKYRSDYVVRGKPEVRAGAARRKAPRHLDTNVESRRLMLSDVLETNSEGSFRHMRRDVNWDGKKLVLAGKEYAKGIAVSVWHEPCSAGYDLTGQGWKSLRGTIGIEVKQPAKLEDKEKKGTRVFFVVRGDGEELYRSEPFLWDSGPVAMDVDIAGVGQLEIEVGNEQRWHCAASSVNWAELRLDK